MKAAQFLLGFGQPYTPAYSYYNSFNSLAPLDYASIVYGGTFPLTDFYYPGYAPGAYYSYGPPFPYVSRVTNVNIVQINNYVRDYHYRGMHNVLPSSRLMNRYPYLRDGIPAAVREGRRFPITRAGDTARAEHALNRPGIVPPPSNLPVQEAKFPRVTPSARAVSPNNLGQLKGMALPRQATQPMTPLMSRQVRLQRQFQGPQRMETRPEFRPLANPAPRRPEGVPQTPVKAIQPSPGQAVQPAPAISLATSAPRRLFPRATSSPRPAGNCLLPPGMRSSRPRPGKSGPPLPKDTIRRRPGNIVGPQPGWFTPPCPGNSAPRRPRFTGPRPGRFITLRPTMLRLQPPGLPPGPRPRPGRPRLDRGIDSLSRMLASHPAGADSQLSPRACP